MAATQPPGGSPGNSLRVPGRQRPASQEGRRGGSAEESEEAGTNFPEKLPSRPTGRRVTGLPAPRREDPPPETTRRGPGGGAGSLEDHPSGLERGSESGVGMTRASGGQSGGRGFAAASARIPATSDAQQGRARVLHHQRARLESLKLPPPLWSVEWVQRAPLPTPPLLLPPPLGAAARASSASPAPPAGPASPLGRGGPSTADARRAAPTLPKAISGLGPGGERLGRVGGREGREESELGGGGEREFQGRGCGEGSLRAGVGREGRVKNRGGWRALWVSWRGREPGAQGPATGVSGPETE